MKFEQPAPESAIFHRGKPRWRIRYISSATSRTTWPSRFRYNTPGHASDGEKQTLPLACMIQTYSFVLQSPLFDLSWKMHLPQAVNDHVLGTWNISNYITRSTCAQQTSCIFVWNDHNSLFCCDLLHLVIKFNKSSYAYHIFRKQN